MDRERRAGRGEGGERLALAASARRGRRCASARAIARRPAASAPAQAPPRRRRRPARPASSYRGCPQRSSRRNCSPIALQIERSPECSRATSWPARCASTQMRDDLVEIERRGVDDARARRAMVEQRLRYQRARIEADRAARDEVASAQGDEVGRAGSGADEMHGHGASATARWRRSPRPPRGAARAAVRQRPRPRAPRLRRCSATPNARSAAGDGVRMRRRLGAKRRERQPRQRRADQPRRLARARLARFVGEGEHAPFAFRRTRFRERARRKRGDRLARDACAAADADGDEAAHGLTQRHCTTGIAGRQP